MADAPLPPVPQITKAGFADPVWARWLNLLRGTLNNVIFTSTLTINNFNGFSGTVTPTGTNSAQITLSVTASGILKGSGGAIVAASPGTDFVQTVSVTAPITNTGTAANPNISHANSGVGAGTYTKVTVNATGHVTAGASINSGDVTGALGYTPLNPANNLSDVASAATARTNLGLGTIATQNANAVTISGGTINGTSVGATVRSTGAFTTLDANGNEALLYRNTSAQSFTSGAAAVVTNWTSTWDRLGANFNATTGTYTAPATGYYFVSCGLLWAANTGAIGTIGQINLLKNGATILNGLFERQTTNAVPMLANCSGIFFLTAGDTVQVQGLQNTGGAVLLAASAGGNYLSVNRVP